MLFIGNQEKGWNYFDDNSPQADDNSPQKSCAQSSLNGIPVLLLLRLYWLDFPSQA